MNKFYIIFPLAALILFAVYYTSFHAKFEAQREAEKVAAEQKQAEEQRVKKEAEEKAAKEAQAKLEEQKRQDDEAKAKKAAEQKEKDDRVLKDIETLTAKTNDLSTELGKLQADLSEKRRARTQLQDETFNVAHEVESMKIQRRTAENEIQRATQMLADRIGASSMADATFFANPTPPPKQPAK